MLIAGTTPNLDFFFEPSCSASSRWNTPTGKEFDSEGPFLPIKSASRKDMIDTAGKEVLCRAFKATCDELQWHYRIGPNDLSELVDTIALALYEVYRTGQRDEGRLANYAIKSALSQHAKESY